MKNFVTVLTKDNCFRCDFVIKMLKKRGVPYEVKNLKELEDSFITDLRNDGITSAPVLYYKGERSSGVDMVLIEKAMKDLL